MITLYHVPSVRSRRSSWQLNELGIEFELVEMVFDLKVLRAPEFLAIHPLGRAPVYQERYEWLQWMHYAETVAVYAASLVQQSVFIPEEQRSPIVQKSESCRLEKAVEILDNHLKDRAHLLASGFSAADVNVGYSSFLGAPFISFDGFPNTMKYYDRIRERPAFQASVPKEGK